MPNSLGIDAIIANYAKQGLVTEFIEDLPGKVYSPHKHHKTHLYTVKGQVEIILDDSEKLTSRIGEELIVGRDQLHSAVVGEEGWSYVAAWDVAEAEKYKGIVH